MADETAPAPSLNAVEDFPYVALPLLLVSIAGSEDVRAVQGAQTGADVQRFEP